MHFARGSKVEDIFSNQTVRDLSAKIILKDVPLEEIKSVIPKEYYSTSASQKGMFLTDMMGDLGVAYNLPMLLEFSGDLNREQLGIALDKLVERHEALRTSFDIIDGEVVQKIHDSIDFKKEYAKIGANELEDAVHECIEPFDLTQVC